MTRDDLLTANGRIIRSVVEKAVQTSPDAIVLCVTNPLDIMVDLAWKVSGLPAARVFGMGGVLDSARFAHFIAQETGADISTVDALACGAHGDAMVPMPRHSYIDGKRLTDLLSADRVRELRKRTIFGGAEVVSLLKTGSAVYAPAASIVSMVKAVLTDSGSVMPSCVRLNGEYGIEGVHMSVPARIGRAGVLEVPELDVDDVERTALQESAETIRVSIASLEAMDA
jgi:malate dehydrogenase